MIYNSFPNSNLDLNTNSFEKFGEVFLNPSLDANNEIVLCFSDLYQSY